MEWWQIALLLAGTSMLVLLVAVFILWRKASGRTKQLAERIQHLSWQAKLQLAAALMRDERIPLIDRLIPPAVVLYLSMPLDIVPDFIPVLGQLDDILVIAVGIGLMLRFTPLHILEAHISSLESAQVQTPADTQDKASSTARNRLET